MRTRVQSEEGLGGVDMTLVVLFILGIYLNIQIQLSQRIPFPDALSGLIALVMLWRERNRVSQAHIAGLSIVFLVYFASMFFAPKPTVYFSKRFTGLVQLTYSLVIGYALFLVMTQATRRQLAKMFMWFCLVLIVGCLLETYGGLRPISDKFRETVFSAGVYAADLRDQELYGRIRPKFFTSEPSYVTFCYTIFLFAWFVFSEWRWKFLGYLTLLGIGQFAMPGPTLLLSLAMVVPYELLLGGAPGRTGLNYRRMFKVVLLGAFLGVLFITIGLTLYSARLQLLNSGRDASFFFRETGPALLARWVAVHYPFAGIGLTSERFIANQMLSVYEASPAFSSGWYAPDPETMLTNYFWTHWVYLGVIFGTAAIAAISYWLRLLRVPSPMFSWAVWAVMGQSMGAYVGPRAWFVLFLAAAGAVLHQRIAHAAPTPVRPVVNWRPAMTRATAVPSRRRRVWRTIPG